MASYWEARAIKPLSTGSLSCCFHSTGTVKIHIQGQSLPALNRFDVSGRVFIRSCLGFLVAFWSRYAFPSLLTDCREKDLNFSQMEIAKPNIGALASALIVRLVAHTARDRFGATTQQGHVVLRFFADTPDGSFTPCQI